METVNTTRMELLLKKEEANSASSGAELLRSKRDVLLAEFFLTLRSLLAQRRGLDEQAGQVTRSLVFALGLEGREKLMSSSFIASKAPGITLSYKNLLGLKIPEIGIVAGKNREGDVNLQDGLVIEETKAQFQDFLNSALAILPQELRLRRLGSEIKSTTRKVNSLEKFVIPRLLHQIKFIQEALEEREREDIFRLKRLKRKRL